MRKEKAGIPEDKKTSYKDQDVRIHSELGPGFNEKVYHTALKLAFEQEGLKYETEKRFEVYYQSKKVGNFIVDLVIEDKIIVEIKAVTGNMPDVFKYQV